MLTRLLRRILAKRSTDPKHFVTAYRLFNEGRSEDADRICEKLTISGSARADALYLRGLIRQTQGKYREAIPFLNAAIDERSTEPTFHLSLAAALAGINDQPLAIPSMKRALALLPEQDPRYLQTTLAIADFLREQQRLDEAAEWYSRALRLSPDHGPALEWLSLVRYQQSRAHEAIEMLQRSPRSKTDAGLRIRNALYLPVLYESVDEITAVRARLDEELTALENDPGPPMLDPVEEVGITPFYLAYHGKDDRFLMEKLARVCRAAYPANVDCGRKPYQKRAKLRIGFVSTFFYFHSVARSVLGFIRDLPREGYEVYVFSLSPAGDDMTKAVREAADFYRVLPGNLAQVRSVIEEAELDVLFFTDIGMHPLTYFLAFWRLAPIQISTWGHPVTSGIDTIDYFVSAEDLETPDGQSYYTERLLPLPAYFLPGYARPGLSGPLKSRAELGLPPGRLYVCPQSLFKLHPEFDVALLGILERDPLARIVLFDGKISAWSEKLRARLARTLRGHNARVHFIPRASYEDFLQVNAHADVVLDPFHFSGANTACEILSLGVPVITLPSRFLRGRFAAALYAHIDVGNCIASSVDDYIDKAMALAQNDDLRQHVRTLLKERSPSLFDRREISLLLGSRIAEIAEAMR